MQTQSHICTEEQSENIDVFNLNHPPDSNKPKLIKKMEETKNLIFEGNFIEKFEDLTKNNKKDSNNQVIYDNNISSSDLDSENYAEIINQKEKQDKMKKLNEEYKKTNKIKDSISKLEVDNIELRKPNKVYSKYNKKVINSPEQNEKLNTEKNHKGDIYKINKIKDKNKILQTTGYNNIVNYPKYEILSINNFHDPNSPPIITHIPNIKDKLIVNNKYKRIPIFSSKNDCLFISILKNLELPTVFVKEIKVFLSKYTEENLSDIATEDFTIDRLRKRVEELKNDEILGEDIDLFILSYYLNVNFIIVDEEYIILKKINHYLNLSNTALFFIVNDKQTHIEPLVQIGLIQNNKILKEKIQRILFDLITIRETNKEITIKINDDKLIKDLTIAEIDKIKLNSLYESNATIEFSVKDNKKFQYILDYSKSIKTEDLKKYDDFKYEIIKLSESKNIVNKNQQNLKKQENEELEEILNFELSNIPNIVCILCSREYKYNNKEFLILRYFLNISKYNRHIRTTHSETSNKDNYIHIKNFKRNFGLVAKQNGNRDILFLIKKEFINNNGDIFKEFDDEVQDKNENYNELIKEKKDKNNMQKFNIINEIEIDDNFIENIVPNYIKYLDNDLKIEAKEFFNDYEIRKYEIDFNNNDINKYEFSKYLKKINITHFFRAMNVHL